MGSPVEDDGGFFAWPEGTPYMNALDVALLEGLADREEARMILIGGGKVQEELLVARIVMIFREPVPVGISDCMHVKWETLE